MDSYKHSNGGLICMVLIEDVETVHNFVEWNKPRILR